MKQEFTKKQKMNNNVQNLKVFGMVKYVGKQNKKNYVINTMIYH